MQKSDIRIGQEYALREARSRDAPLQRIRILQHVRGKKWKAEWIDPNPGLVEYVESQDLLCLWKERKAILLDEQRERQLREDNVQRGYENDSPLDNAVTEVFDAVGEPGLSFYRGVLSARPEAFERIKGRARLDNFTTTSTAYQDRHGTFHLPFVDALAIAQAFSAAEPSTVLVGVEATEQKWSQEARQPGHDYLVNLLNEYRAAWAIIRQWAGHDAAIAQREARIQQLERLVWDAIYALQKAGLEKEVDRLRRAIQRS